MVKVTWYRKYKHNPYHIVDDEDFGYFPSRDRALDHAFFCEPTDWKPGDRVKVAWWPRGGPPFEFRVGVFAGQMSLTQIYR